MFDLTNRKILALGAHPDDIELGCLGLLMMAQQRGSQIECVCMTAPTTARHREFRAAINFALGERATAHVYDFTDGELRCEPETVGRIERHLDDVDLVLTMAQWDTHQDHRALERITVSACRRRPLSLLNYNSMSSTNEFRADLFVELPARIVERKIDAIALHQTQAERSYTKPEFIRQWHADRTALLMGLPSVELYHVHRLVERIT